MKKIFIITAGLFVITLFIFFSFVVRTQQDQKEISHPTTMLQQQTTKTSTASDKEIEKPSQNIEWKQVVNTEHGYSINYPAHWSDYGNQTTVPTIPGSSIIKSRLFYLSKNQEEYSIPQASFEIKVYTMSPETSSEFIAANDEDRVKETSYSPGSSVPSLEPVVIGGLEGIRYTLDGAGTASSGGFMLDVVLQDNATIFEFEALAQTKEMFSEYQEIFEQMIKSFQLI